jgi:regulatory protein
MHSSRCATDHPVQPHDLKQRRGTPLVRSPGAPSPKKNRPPTSGPSACWSARALAQGTPRKLVAKGVEREPSSALDTLSAAGFPERRRASPPRWPRSRAAAGYGPARIRAELATHGLPRRTIAAGPRSLRARLGCQRRDVAARRFGQGPARSGMRRKALDFLLRRASTARASRGADVAGAGDRRRSADARPATRRAMAARRPLGAPALRPAGLLSFAAGFD